MVTSPIDGRVITPSLSSGDDANSRSKKSPADEAIAAPVVRLRAGDRPVVIFTAQARSLSTRGRATLRVLDVAGAPAAHEWPEREEGEVPPLFQGAAAAVVFACVT